MESLTPRPGIREQHRPSAATLRSGSSNLAAPQPTFVLDETGDLVDSLSRAQIAKDERPRAPHALGVAFHECERGADMGRQIDLVDHQEVGAGDARAALRWNSCHRRRRR